MYVKTHFHQDIFDSRWAWNKHVKKLRVASSIETTWIEFVNFLREIINLIKQWITRVDKILLDLRQRSRQSIIQLIAYLKTLKEQWIDSIQDSIRVLFLTQILHLYIRRELIRRQINTINRREIEKKTQDIEAIKFVSTHLKRKNDDSHKTNDFDSKQRRIRNNTSSKNVFVVAFVASVVLSRSTDDRKFDKWNKFVSRERNFQRDQEFENATSRNFVFACYNCDDLNHFKNKYQQFIREKKTLSC